MLPCRNIRNCIIYITCAFYLIKNISSTYDSIWTRLYSKISLSDDTHTCQCLLPLSGAGLTYTGHLTGNCFSQSTHIIHVLHLKKASRAGHENSAYSSSTHTHSMIILTLERSNAKRTLWSSHSYIWGCNSTCCVYVYCICILMFP